MFGYIRTFPPELKLKEFELYRYAYCGICKSLGKCCGNCSRVFLNYDSVFLFFLRTALTKKEFEITKNHCIRHPFRKIRSISGTEETDYAARTLALLSYHKIKDNIRDERFPNKLLNRLILPIARNARNRSSLVFLDIRCDDILAGLEVLERENCESIDKPAEQSGLLCAELFSNGFKKDSEEYMISYTIGLHMGKVIYFLDSLDDYNSDIRKKEYNPYAVSFGRHPLTEENTEFIKESVYNEIGEIRDNLDKIDFQDIDGIKNLLYNIVCYGIPERLRLIIEKYTKHPNKEHGK